MKKIFTFLLGASVCTLAMAQRPDGVIKQAGDNPPMIDGVIDDVWANANQYNIDKKFRTEEPTFGDEGTTYWKALWDDSGIYVLVVANDDDWFPNWAPGGGANNWEYDKPELYFDSNYVLEDGIGGQASPTGHQQIAPGSADGAISGEAQSGTANGAQYNYAYMVNNPDWLVEYFVPWEAIPDKDGLLFDKTGTMGFDITLIDRDHGDEARKRAQWANVGAIDESWNNMDDAGHLTFDGAEAGVYVDVIKVAAGEITTDNGTLQLTATIEPADASNQKLKWTIEAGGTGSASIDAKTGVLTAISNGTIMVKAAATDGGWAESDVVEITISGQVIDKNDVWNSFNKITNWSFEDGKAGDFPTAWGGWVDGAVADQVVPAIEDGVCVMKVGLSADNWHYQLNQSNLTCEANVPYILKFKTWASADATPCAVDFESASAAGVDQYARYGTSTDPEAGNGDSEWHYSVGTTPTWFTFHVVFDKMIDGTIQKIQWMNSLSNETIYLDSVLLIKESDFAMSAKQLSNLGELKVYPNPVGSASELTVSMAKASGKVAIYNSLGQKVMEKAAITNVVKFDVASLRKGLYFVRLEDGTTQKFIR